VLVVNRPGAGGAIGYKYVQAQKPDGYSLVWNSNSISTTYHSGQLGFRLPGVRRRRARAGRVRGARGEERLALAHAAGFRREAKAKPKA
jgi:tripartite-type tricarboxylate transporter receptor subunit TctC